MELKITTPPDFCDYDSKGPVNIYENKIIWDCSGYNIYVAEILL